MSRSHLSPSRVARTTRAARAWLACAWLCVLAMLGACGGEPPTPLRVATNNWPGHWPLYLAHHRGQLDARLQELSSATEVLRAFRNHRIDVGAFTIEEFLQLLDEGNDPHVLLVVDYSNGADSVIARPPLASVADLRGHVIGTENTAMGRLCPASHAGERGTHGERRQARRLGFRRSRERLHQWAGRCDRHLRAHAFPPARSRRQGGVQFGVDSG
jgi:hypothetical protein